MKVIIQRDKLLLAQYKSGLNVQDVCAKAAITRTTWSNLMKSQNYFKVSPPTLKRICDALGLNIEDIVEVVEITS